MFGREGRVWFEGSPNVWNNPVILGLEAIIRKGFTKGRGLYIYIYTLISIWKLMAGAPKNPTQLKRKIIDSNPPWFWVQNLSFPGCIHNICAPFMLKRFSAIFGWNLNVSWDAQSYSFSVVCKSRESVPRFLSIWFMYRGFSSLKVKHDQSYFWISYKFK